MLVCILGKYNGGHVIYHDINMLEAVEHKRSGRETQGIAAVLYIDICTRNAN